MYIIKPNHCSVFFILYYLINNSIIDFISKNIIKPIDIVLSMNWDYIYSIHMSGMVFGLNII